MKVVLPLHPRTRKIAVTMGLVPELVNSQLTTYNSQLLIVSPVGYFDMIELLKNTRIILTDSGGVQKEAFFFKKPCVTLRDETEWVELVNRGFNKLAGAEKEKIINAYNEMIDKQLDFHIDLYGNGQAGRNIVSSIKNNNQIPNDKH